MVCLDIKIKNFVQGWHIYICVICIHIYINLNAYGCIFSYFKVCIITSQTKIQELEDAFNKIKIISSYIRPEVFCIFTVSHNTLLPGSFWNLKFSSVSSSACLFLVGNLENPLKFCLTVQLRVTFNLRCMK